MTFEDPRSPCAKWERLGSETDGWVYLGIAGREFALDSRSTDDFDRVTAQSCTDERAQSWDREDEAAAVGVSASADDSTAVRTLSTRA
ncbi:hypothetical protein SHO565_74180 [Streptomyces sp. HO565]